MNSQRAKGRDGMRGLKDGLFVLAVGAAYIVGIAVALWLVWLGAMAFLIYGYQAIAWVLL